MMLITDLPANNTNLFDCISTKHESALMAKETEILDYMITFYPRSESHNNFSFVYSLGESYETAFSLNQQTVVNIAHKLFSNSMLLEEFEQEVLNNTFKRLIKIKPTLSGRK